MKRTHAAAIAILLGVAGTAGTVAATRTAGLGASPAQPTLSERQIVQRSRKLDRFEASLRRSLAQRPPALPSAARSTASSLSRALASAPPPAAAAPVAQRIVYRRPAPIVVTAPRPGGVREEGEGHEADDDEAESYQAEGQGHSRSGAGGDDD